MIRLLLENQNISIDQNITLKDNAFHYLANVMRCKLKDSLEVFNGNSSSFLAEIIEIQKKSILIKIYQEIKEYRKSSNISLAFAINKKNDFIAEKATELGVAKFQPLITTNTFCQNFNDKRFYHNVKEAVEQSERNDLPTIESLTHLEKWLAKIDFTSKILIFCSERGGQRIINIFNKIKFDDIDCTNNPEIIILVGPEGGFSNEEFHRISQLTEETSKIFSIPRIYQISLGQEILRLETAIISSIAIIKEFMTQGL